MDGNDISFALRPARPANNFRVEFDRLPSQLVRSVGRERNALRVLAASGRGSVLNGRVLPSMALVPLRGIVRVSSSEGTRVLRKGQIMIVEAGQCLQATGGSGSLWIAIIAPTPLWRQLFSTMMDTPVPEPVLLPAVHRADRELRRAIVRLARAAARPGAGRSEAVVPMLRFVMLLADLQSQFDELVRKCPGRTLAQRRGVFLRLQRVYNWMQSSTAVDLDIRGFARVANYSTCHFVRTFSAVFGETPYSVVMEQKLRRAFHLVYDTELSITEVARAAGFEDRCAFARSFKRRFGKTATEVRSRTIAAVA
ncbi:MAG TPA: AraC family transcriptional regulator [Rhodanobacteraceae bacterium]|jgi:AraC family transcriptional regulator